MTNKVTHRVLSMLLAMAMLLSMMPVSAFAAETGTEAATEPVTVEATEAATEAETEPATEAETEPATEETEAATEETEAATEETEAATEETEAAAEETEPATEETLPSEEEAELAVELLAEEEGSGVIYEDGRFGYKGYYNVISRKDYVLVPDAAFEYEMVLNNDAGNRRQVIHVIEVDPSNPDVSIVPGYNQIDKVAEDPNNEANWSHKELTDMAAYYEANLGYKVVGGMNTDLYYDTYAPRILVYNGKDISVKGNTTPSSSILYVFKDAEGNISCEVKAFNRSEFDQYLEEGILLHAVSVSFAMVVKNGKLVNTKETRESSGDAARSMVGVKEDGTLVICMNDGRGANNSEGLSGDFEEGEVMLALGCQWAANCDGGGSSTFLSKRVGEETFTMRSVPCDGAQRPTAHGVFVVSNVGPTGELNNVNIESEYDIFAPKTVYTFGAEAIDTHGYAMELPEDAAWALSDEAFGTIENGKFTSNGTKGKVTVQVLSGGNVVGEKVIEIADPAVFKLSATSTVVPYSTPEKVREIMLPIVAMTGEADVYVDTNAVSVVLSNEKAGTIDGFKFTATSDTSVSGTEITIVYGETELVYTVSFGKGSEVVFDFEDGERAGFMGFEEAKAWSIDNGVENSLIGSDPLAGQFNEYLSSDTYVVTAEEGGQVRNGDYALAWSLDNTDAAFASWSYNVLFNTNDRVVFRDVENGKKATTLGMWVYIPENAFPSAGKGLAFQSQFYGKRAGSSGCFQDHFMFTSAATGNRTNLNSATNADIPESRWVYMSIDISSYDYLSTMDPVETASNSRSPSFVRTYVKPETADVVTFYIDDITLDYSSAVDDRVLPTITNPTYSTSDTAVALENGQVIEGNKVAFSATVADNAGLDRASGKIYVDGVAVKAAISGSTLSSKEDVTLVAGQHTVAFEVKDELGNPGKITRTFTVSGDAVLSLDGHNDSGAAAKAQSVYYVDIKAADLTKVGGLTAKLKLNNSNTWETEGAVVANGFEASFSYNEISELLTVTVEAVGGVSAKAADQTLVSIPVRVWTYDRFNYVTETYRPISELTNKPVVDIICDVVYGNVRLADGSTSPFGGSINVDTELTTISSPYHEHDAQLTVLNKEATTEEAGYENRTYCQTCQSVVEWGTVIPKIEITHNYQIVDGKFVCQDEGCGHVYASGTGVFEMNGSLYYSINGVLKTGWQTADEGYCYAGPDYKLYIGERSVNGITYVFDAEGSTKGAWTTNATGTRYSYGPAFYARMWVEMDGKTYYFGTNSYMYTGIRFVKDNPDTPAFWYDFGEDGATDKTATVADGLYEVKGDHYIVMDGETKSGIYLIDGAYYYGGIGSGFDRFGCIAKNTTMSVSTAGTNGVITSGVYTFGADGKMVINHGPVGAYFYDENGHMVHGYKVVEFEGNYYYVADYHKYVTNKRVYLTSADLAGTDLKAGYFDFDEAGKMILQSGPDTDGYFYLNGVKQLAYQLVEFEGDYYYIGDYNKYVVNKKVYLTSADVEGTPFKAGTFEFGADGKMVRFNGPKDDGFFYIDGVKQLAYQFVEFDGDYYYIGDYNKYVVNKKVYLTSAAVEGTPFKAGYFNFGADGKMILQNGPEDDGYFYVDGVKQLAYQFVEFEGDYYYIGDYNKYVINKRIYLTSADVEGTPFKAGYFDFGADGKMIVLNGPNADGYFYLNGVKQLAYQLIEFEGDFYYITDYNKYAVNKRIYLVAADVEGTNLARGYYNFGADGKLIRN